jgi:fluoroquinolone transport system ATP-binding protein
MDGIGENAGFLKLLREGGIVSMHTLEASLDDVFIAATGGGDAAS